MNPYIKLFLLLLCTTLLIVIHDRAFSIMFSLTIIFFCIYSISNISSRIKPILLVSCMVILFQLLGNFSAPIGERFFLGIISSCRLMALSLLVFLFSQTTSVSEIIKIFAFLPYSLRLMMTISFSLIPVIMHEVDVIRIAQQSRGLEGNGIYAWKRFLPIIVPLLNRTLTRAQQIAIVLETRGY